MCRIDHYSKNKIYFQIFKFNDRILYSSNLIRKSFEWCKSFLGIGNTIQYTLNTWDFLLGLFSMIPWTWSVEQKTPLKWNFNELVSKIGFKKFWIRKTEPTVFRTQSEICCLQCLFVGFSRNKTITVRRVSQLGHKKENLP